MVDAERKCWLPGMPALGLGGQCALLAGVTVTAGAIIAGVAYGVAGSQGVWATMVAAVLCLVGSELALMLTRLGQQPTPGAALTGMLLGMICRLGIPLFGSLAIRLTAPSLFAAGALYYLIALYLVTLAAEVALELCNVTLPKYRARRPS